MCGVLTIWIAPQFLEEWQNLRRSRVGRRWTTFGASTKSTNASIVAAIMSKDQLLTLEEIKQEANSPKTSAQCIMKEMLQKINICSCWVLHCLNKDQCAWCKEVAMWLRSRYQSQGEGFLKCIIVIDETWVFASKPEWKPQSMEWKGRGLPYNVKFLHQPSKCNQWQSRLTIVWVFWRAIVLQHMLL